jgi:peptidyl-prolyl cis-trans isomerase SurA
LKGTDVRIKGTVFAAMLIGAAWGLAGATLAASNPYAPAVLVNQAVITNYDIEQRMQLVDALGGTGDLRKIAIQQLTEDRVKVQAGKAMGIELPEGAIETGIDEFARQRGLAPEDVDKVLEARKIDRQTMSDFVEAGIMWREVLIQRFRARATPSEEDLDQALAIQARQPREVVKLAELAIPFAERGEPETLALADQLYRQLSRGGDFAAAAREYSRSATGPEGGALPPMGIDEVPPAVRNQVALMRPGQVTRPTPVAGGLALIKLISVRDEPPGTPPDPKDPEVRDALRQRLFSERINSFGQGYLQELLSDALIVQK